MFDRGSQIRVRRQAFGFVPYWHHGIFVGDGQVVEFGGGSLLNKGHTRVRRVGLSCFEGGARAEAVSHPITWKSLEYPPQLLPDEVVDRAAWLLYNQPPPYQLGYRNCESIAVWCATGAFESFQVKKFMSWKGPIALLLVAWLYRVKSPLAVPVGVVSTVVGMFTAFPYLHSWAFFNHTKRYRTWIAGSTTCASTARTVVDLT